MHILRLTLVVLSLFFSASAGAVVETILLDEGADCTVLVPSEENGGSALGATWQSPGVLANAEAWQEGKTGIGFDNGPPFLPHFQLEVEELMKNTNASIFLRVSFTIADADTLASYGTLKFFAKYDDGFVAYLNGTEIARANAPEGNPSWDAEAEGSHSDSLAVNFEEFDATGGVGSLRVGENVLAVQAMNTSAGGSDFLMSPKLVATDEVPLVWPELVLVETMTGLSDPVALKHAGDGSGRLFVVEQAGRIRMVEEGQRTTFLNISARVRTGGERGLLGLAFPPGFPEKSHFYVYYTGRERDDEEPAIEENATVVSRFQLNPEGAGDPDSEEVLLTIEQPFSNHNGGDIHFGPDGFLYIGTGDGGSGGDPGNRSQNPQNLLGKMLRIDVEGAPDPGLAYAIPTDNPFVSDSDVRNELWAIGLRNPWRWSFDRQTGDIYIGDVGQNAVEEIDFQPAGVSGLNYEWRRLEGESTFSGGTQLGVGIPTPPILHISQSQTGNRSITGGYVYRGSRWPRMVGQYIYGDYVSGKVYASQINSEGVWVAEELERTRLSISAFGEDEEGELYLIDYDGDIYRIEDTVAAAPAAILAVTSVSLGEATVTLTLPTVPGRTYQLEASSDMLSWSGSGDPVSATAPETQVSGPATESARYYRVAEFE